MSKVYTPANWYWIVAGSSTQVYSSAVSDYVPVGNASYVAWLVVNAPTPIDTEANLGGVLATYLLRPIPPNVLDGYRDAIAAQTIAMSVFKVLFNHENRLRAIERNLNLNGSPADLTAGQAKAAVKALM